MQIDEIQRLTPSFPSGYQHGGADQFAKESISLSGSFDKWPGVVLQLPVGSGFGVQMGNATTTVTGSVIITPRTYMTPPIKVDHTMVDWWTMGGRRMPW